MSRISTCQTEHSVRFDTLNSALVRMRQNLEAIQARNEHIASNLALNSKKVSAVESNQTKILDMLSGLRNGSDDVQGRLEKIENNVTPKSHDAAARNMITPSPHDAAAVNIITPKFQNAAADKVRSCNSKFRVKAAENSSLQAKTFSPEKDMNGKPLNSSNLSSTKLDVNKTEAARPTSVLNSPVKEKLPQNKPHSSKMTPADSVNSPLLPAEQSSSVVRTVALKFPVSPNLNLK